MIDFPIGTPEERRAAVSGLPGNWLNSNPYANHYQLKPGLWQYHDGVDLNLNLPVFNSDWHKAIYAVDDGIVTFAGPGGGTWGHIIDTKHVTPAGRYYVSRVGHIENILVETGDPVTAGQQIASVGTGDGQFSAHLHWNVSQLDDPIMLDKPNQWCGADLACVLAHYVDPVQFVLDGKKGVEPVPTISKVMALDNLVIRSAPNLLASKLSGRVDRYAIFDIADYRGSVAYTKLADRPGYVSTSWITGPLMARAVRVLATPSLRVRAKPSETAEILPDRLPLGRILAVWGGSEIGGYIKLIDQPGWVAAQYLETLSLDPAYYMVDNIPDISHFTEITDFSLAFKNRPLLIHKGTQGVSYVDPLFRQRRSDFLALNPAGDVLLWHNGTNHDPIAQAKHCLRTCADGVTGIALDLESISAEEGGTMTLSQAEAFVNYIHAQTGIWIAVYCRPAYLLAIPSILTNCPLWLASAANPPILPFQWQSRGWRLLQYDQKLIGGIPDPVDINRFWDALPKLKPFIRSIAPAAPDDAPPTDGTGGGGHWGLNIDPYNAVGEPLIRASLKGSSFVRISFLVADKRQNLTQAFAFYDPIIAAYAALGIKVLLIISQSSFNEGMPYPNTPYTWAEFIPGFATFCTQVAMHYAGEIWGLEIWNEPDVQGTQTSVYVPPAEFGDMLRAVFKAIAGAGLMKIVSGGLASGDPVGYLKQAGDLTLALDYLGVHPYGKTLPDLMNVPGANGQLRPYLSNLLSAFPGKPIAITEYGFFGAYTADPTLWPVMAKYMQETFYVITDEYARVVGPVIWFAYSDTMAEAGIVTADRKPKGQLFTQYFENVKIDNYLAGGPPPDGPAQPVTRYVIANPYVNVRKGPGISYDDVGDILYRTEVLIDVTTMQGGFVRLIESEPAAQERWVSQAWISEKQPPAPVPQPPPPPPVVTPAKVKIGFHVVQSDDWFRHRDFLLNMFHAGALAGATIVNNTELANILVQAGVPYVIHRTVRDGYEGIEQLSGTADDERKGRNAYYGNNQLTALDKRVIIQPFGYNESNRNNDGFFALGIAKAATEDGRLAVLFNDPVGNPDAWLNPDGTFNCPTFKGRASSGVLEYMVQRGHYYGYHGYGPGGSGANPPATGNEPGSSIFIDGHREDDRWKWYGGRLFEFYKTVPETMRPRVILNEAGFFNADFNKGGGVAAVLNDTKGYEIRLANEPTACSANLWTLGEKFFGGASDISAAIPAYEAEYVK